MNKSLSISSKSTREFTRKAFSAFSRPAPSSSPSPLKKPLPPRKEQ